MPKLLHLRVGVEEIALGTVMVRLNNMAGVASVEVDLGDSKPKPNGHMSSHKHRSSISRKHFAMTGDNAMLKILAAHKTPVSLNDINTMFTKEGRAFKSASPILTILKKQGLVSRPSEGHYTLTSKGRGRVKNISSKAVSS
jgi:predicted transcriptional regulator